jgi:hypothetical protein
MIVSIKDVPLSKTFSNGSLFDRPEAGSPNGGYLAKLLLQAANADVVSGQLAPRVVAVQFISPPTFEPMRIDIELLRMSSNSCFLSVRASQEEHVRTVAHLSFGKSQSGPYHQPPRSPKRRILKPVWQRCFPRGCGLISVNTANIGSHSHRPPLAAPNMRRCCAGSASATCHWMQATFCSYSTP